MQSRGADRPLQPQFLPQRSSLASLDHLVGAGEQRDRYVDAERARCLKIDFEPNPIGFLHGEVGGMGASKDFSGDDASLVKDAVDAGAVARQPARVREVLWIIDGGNAKARRKRGDLLVVRGEERLRVDDQTRRLLRLMLPPPSPARQEPCCA